LRERTARTCLPHAFAASITPNKHVIHISSLSL
jgi:hypothetical protein